MEIVHRKGASHNNADSLSRRPFDEDSHLGSMEDPGDGNAFCSYVNSSEILIGISYRWRIKI